MLLFFRENRSSDEALDPLKGVIRSDHILFNNKTGINI